MLNFPVPPEYCLILKALNDTSSLREAAIMLDHDPGALARKIQKISTEYSFVHKIENRWVLTEQGRRLVQWVDESAAIQHALLGGKPTFRIASYVWLTEQVLIPYFHTLDQKTADKYIWSFKVLFANFEKELLGSRVDFGFAAHAPFDPEISHKKLAGDYWCIIAPTSWEDEMKGMSKDQIADYLKKKPFIRRDKYDIEEAVGFAPQEIAHINVQGVPAIQTAVIHGHGWSCVPSIAVKTSIARKDLFRVDYQLSEFGEIYLWWLRSRKDLKEPAAILGNWFNSCLS